MALGTLGADISEQTFYLDAECSRFQGKDIYFTKSSVGATQQAILAAVMAQGVTKLHNCAKNRKFSGFADIKINGSVDQRRGNKGNYDYRDQGTGAGKLYHTA